MGLKVVCLSGGIDSAVVAARLAGMGDRVVALHYEYEHQAQQQEARATAAVARALGLDLEWRRINPPVSGIMDGSDDPVVIGRNMLMVADAVCRADELGGGEVHVGFNENDHDVFPDCRQEFVDAMNALLAAVGIVSRVVAPLMGENKRDIYAESVERGVVNMTWSCYYPRHDGYPCAQCMSCRERGVA